MARGGSRLGSGRRSQWASSTQTKAVRIPEWMMEDILQIALKLDKGESLDFVHNQNRQLSASESSLSTIIEKWETLIPPEKQKLPRWQKASELLEELKASLSEWREGGEKE